MLSRSTASSRAIPTKKQIDKVLNNPFYPSWLGKNQSGMQANEEVSMETKCEFKHHWSDARLNAVEYAEKIEQLGVHKQIVNRLLEPWMYVTTIVSATDWHNFFKLRCHPDAQPEFMVLAFRMLEAYLNSSPMKTDMHIPFGDQMHHGLSEDDRMLVACARCARISYDNFNGERDSDEDIRLAKSLIASGHMSPFEHVARATHARLGDTYVGNFRGWIQYRKRIPHENVVKTDLQKIMLTKPDWV